MKSNLATLPIDITKYNKYHKYISAMYEWEIILTDLLKGFKVNRIIIGSLVDKLALVIDRGLDHKRYFVIDIKLFNKYIRTKNMKYLYGALYYVYYNMTGVSTKFIDNAIIIRNHYNWKLCNNVVTSDEACSKYKYILEK